MKRFATLTLACLSLALSSCAAIGPALEIGSAIIARGGHVEMRADQALIIANNAYQGAVALISVPVRAHQFDDAQLSMIETLSNQALALLEGTSDTSLTMAQRAASVMTMVKQLNDIRLAARPSASLDQPAAAGVG